MIEQEISLRYTRRLLVLQALQMYEEGPNLTEVPGYFKKHVTSWVYQGACLLLMLGCSPFAAPDADPIKPPALYHEMWDSAQACTGRRGDFDELRFLVVPGFGFECPSGMCAGHTEGRTIWLAEDWQLHPMVVKHEMIHALGFQSGHPPVPFESPCKATWNTYGR